MRHRLAPIPRLGSALLLCLLLPPPSPLEGGVDRWTPVGPEGGTVRALAISSATPEVIYAGVAGGGVFRSVNGGATWRAASQGLPLGITVVELAVAPSNPSVLYGATAQGVFRSTDAAGSWVLRGQVPGQGGWFGALLVDPTDPARVYAATDAGIFRSPQGGQNWQRRDQGLPVSSALWALAHHPSRSGTLWASFLGHGVYRTTDGGATWTPSSSGLGPNPAALWLAVDPQDGDRLFLGVGSTGALHRSDDGGRNWALVNPELPSNGRALTVVPTAPPSLFLNGYDHLWVSTDGGTTFSSADQGITTPVLFDLAFSPTHPATGYAATEIGGVFKTTDGGRSWRWSSRGFVATTVRRIVPDPLTPSTLYAGISFTSVMGVAARSREGGASWELLGGDLRRVEYVTVEALAVDPSHPETLYQPVFNGFFRSDDAGDTWRLTSDLFCLVAEAIGVVPTSPSRLFVSGHLGFSFCAVDPTACGVYRSDDAGETFTCVDKQMPGFRAFAADPTDSATLYAGFFGVSKSVDGGDTWFPASAGLGDALVRGLAVDPLSPSIVWAATDEGLLRSGDGGGSWAPVSGLPSGPVRSLAIDPLQPSTVYAGVAGVGVFGSDDRGESWALLGEGLPAAAFQGYLALDAVHPHVLYAGTDGRGAWRLTRRWPSECSPGPTNLCLAGRFQVEVAWKDFQGRTGVGWALPLTSDTGAFWFFRPGNLELVGKALDGRGLNGHFWFFYGALSTVEYRIDVTDTETGELRTYFNPSGHLASRADTRAFPEEGAAQALAAPSRAGDGEAVATGGDRDEVRAQPCAAPPSPQPSPPCGGRGGSEADAPVERGASACAPSPTALCLQGARFRVEVAWRDFRGRSGVGQAVPLTADTGLFWFFAERNLELLVKVLDGRPVNGHFWFFSGALSSVEYTLTVTDTATGATRTYFNPSGTLQSRADTAAF